MRKSSALAGALAGVIVAVVPASGEDAGIYSFIHAEARGRAHAPVRAAPSYAPAPVEFAAPRNAPTRQQARLPDASPLVKRDPKPIGEVSNPVPALLADETLRPGDLVMFPDGLRVFRGQVGGRHRLSDFAKLGDPNRMASWERKLLARVAVGENAAWSFEGVQPSRTARQGRDVDHTGSTRKVRRARE
jgi:hypothetical protein